MCKIFAMVAIEDSTKAWNLTTACTYDMTKHDSDGYGYVAMGADGEMFGERWLDIKNAWTKRPPKQPKNPPKMPPGFEAILEPGAPVPASMDGYNRFGRPFKVGEQITSILAHGRFATCKKTLKNVHPFVRTHEDGNQVALIHNGVVDTKGLDMTGSDDNDSCGILNAYCDAAAHISLENLEAALDPVRGYYACAIMTSGVGADGHVDVFKSEAASLYGVRVAGVGVIFVTDDDIVKRAAKSLKMRIGGVWKVKSGMCLRINARTGEVMGSMAFVPQARTYTYTHTSYQGGYQGADEDGYTVHLGKHGGRYIGPGSGYQRWQDEREEKKKLQATQSDAVTVQGIQASGTSGTAGGTDTKVVRLDFGATPQEPIGTEETADIIVEDPMARAADEAYDAEMEALLERSEQWDKLTEKEQQALICWLSEQGELEEAAKEARRER